MTTKEEKPRVLLVGPAEPSEGPRVGDRFALPDTLESQVPRVLKHYDDQYLLEKVLRQPLQVSPLHNLLLSLSMLFASQPPAPRPMPSLLAAPYQPGPPVERKPKAQRKAVRRRNRRKGQR